MALIAAVSQFAFTEVTNKVAVYKSIKKSSIETEMEFLHSNGGFSDSPNYSPASNDILVSDGLPVNKGESNSFFEGVNVWIIRSEKCLN